MLSRLSLTCPASQKNIMIFLTDWTNSYMVPPWHLPQTHTPKFMHLLISQQSYGSAPRPSSGMEKSSNFTSLSPFQITGQLFTFSDNGALVHFPSRLQNNFLPLFRLWGVYVPFKLRDTLLPFPDYEALISFLRDTCFPIKIRGTPIFPSKLRGRFLCHMRKVPLHPGSTSLPGQHFRTRAALLHPESTPASGEHPCTQSALLHPASTHAPSRGDRQDTFVPSKLWDTFFRPFPGYGALFSFARLQVQGTHHNFTIRGISIISPFLIQITRLYGN